MKLQFKYLKTFILITIVLSSFSKRIFGQIDTLHYLPPLYFSNTSNSHFEDLYLVLSTFESSPFTVTVETKDGSYSRQVSISQSTPDTIYLGLRMAAPAMIGPSQRNTALSSEGLIVSGSKPFFVNISERCRNHAEVITSKGTVGLGKDFYAGFLYSVYENNYSNNRLRSHFISFMAKENNTYVTVSNPRYLFDDKPSNTFTVVLQAGESYTITGDFLDAPYDDVTINDINGTHLTSNKPIAVTSGTWTGGADNGNARDVGIDQIVPTDIVGTEYAVVRGFGKNHMESVIVIATEDNTNIYLNGSATPVYTIASAGEFEVIPESFYSSNNNMYIESDKPVYAYQSLAGSTNDATPGMVFQPRLTCNASKRVQISYANVLEANPNITLVTQAGSNVTINGNSISGSKSLAGNPNWVTYSIGKSELNNYNPGSTGEYYIESTGALNAALIVESRQVGGGGYYSGFGTVPEISYNPSIESAGLCGSNVLFTASGYSEYTWYKDGEEIPGETGATYTSDAPGRYKVVGITECVGEPSLTYPSNEIRVMPCLSVNPSTYTITEGNTSQPNITFSIELSHAWEEDDVTFTYATTGGTAAAGKDFTNVSGSGTILRGDSTFTVSVPILNDELAEDDETFQLTISAPVNAVLSTATGTCTINDDNDPKPLISIPAALIFPEDTGSVQVEVKLDRESGQTITTGFEIISSTAAQDEDYTASSYAGTITFLPEELSKTITLSIIDDVIDEPGSNEQFNLEIKDIVNAQSGNLNSAISIADNDSTPVISLNSSGSTEGNNLKITGSLTNPSDEEITFEYATSDSEAIAPDDYASVTGQNVVVAPGETSFEIITATVDDVIMEGTEIFNVNFSNLQYAKFSNDSLQVTFDAKIIDNDGKPQVTIEDVSVTEGEDLTFEITVSHPASTAIRLKYATADNSASAPEDYTAVAPKTIVLPPNQLSKTFTVTTAEDTEEEGTETFFVNLSEVTDNAEFEDSIALGTILDNDETPIAKNDNYTLNEDNSLTENVLTNDEGLGDTPITILSNTNPVHGTLTMNTTTGDFTYTPTANFYGRDTIFYTISDADNDESTARVIFTISSVNDVPIANTDIFTTSENTDLTADVLLNDSGLGDGVSVAIAAPTTNGTLNLSPDGTFTYSPNVQFYGTDQFTYKITDGNGDEASTTAKIEVSFSNDYNPVAANDTVSTQEDVPVSIDVAANDTDADGISTLDLESIFVHTNPVNGTVTIEGAGLVSYTPAAGYAGDDSFTYTIRDKDGLESNEVRVFITVTVNNDAPVAVCMGTVNLYLDENGVATLQADDIDDGSYDPDGDAFTRTLSQTSFTSVDLGIKNITLTVKDSYNAQHTCQAEIHVLDTISPIIKTNPPDTVIYTETGKCGMVVNYNLPLFEDNCDGETNGTLMQGYSPGSVFSDTTTIVYEFTDGSGNGPVQVTFDVIVLDTISPGISYTGPTSFIASGDNAYKVTDNSLDVTASDNCSIVSLTHDFDGGGTTLNGFNIPAGTHSITWTATDVSGNDRYFTYSIEIQSPISVTLASLDTDTTVCQGEEILFEATASGGNGTITYNFQVDGVSLQSGHSNSFAISSLADAQEVKVFVTDESLNSAESNEIPVTILQTPITDAIYRQPNK
jgi:hypothetical protein